MSMSKSSFFSEQKNLPQNKINWEDKLMSMESHCNWLMKDDIIKILDEKIVKNLENLYHNIEKYFHFFNIFEFSYVSNDYMKGLQDIEICLLSGELPAIKSLEGLKRVWCNSLIPGKNGWEFASSEGLSEQEYLISILSGSMEAMRYLYEELKLSRKTKDFSERTALHYAAASGSLEQMRYACETLKIKPTLSSWGLNVLHYAAASGSSANMEYAVKNCGISPDSMGWRNQTALHFAAWRGSVEAIRYAYETLKIPLTLTEQGVSILHYVAWSGSVEALNYVIQLYKALNLAIDPTVKDKYGCDVFDYAKKSNKSNDIREILDQYSPMKVADDAPIHKSIKGDEYKSFEEDQRVEPIVAYKMGK